MKRRLTAFVIAVAVYGVAHAGLCGEIHEAARTGDLAAVRRLLSGDPALVRSVGKSNTTALHWAAIGNHVGVAGTLIENGADLNARMERGFTPLHCALMRKSENTAKLLIYKGANVKSASDQGFTCLHYAVKYEAVTLARMLVSRGADPKAKARDGVTPIDWARMQKSDEIIEILGGERGPESSPPAVARIEPAPAPVREDDLVESVRRPNGALTGEIRFSDGAVYTGDMKKGTMDGYGKLTFPDGEVYEGQWKHGRKHGIGIAVLPNGDEYLGGWEDNVRSGKGRYRFPDGENYDGEWRYGEMHGRGVYTFASGKKLDGEWREGRFVSSAVP